MSNVPVVAIVGRPNVGKSSLFNALYGERISIVHDMPGVTRDRLYARATWREREFLMIDTGGIELDSDDEIMVGIRDQAQIAIDTADVILFMCDLKSGLTESDRDIAVMLRKSGRPLVACVNKLDHVGFISWVSGIFMRSPHHIVWALESFWTPFMSIFRVNPKQRKMSQQFV